MNDIGVKRVCAVTFIQAFKDWERLCDLLAQGRIIDNNGITMRGPKSTAGFNVPRFGFGEIENFIRANAELWVDMDPELIMIQLYRIRRRAVAKARALH